MDRGGPVDRYYIERFLAAHSSDIRGRVMEVGEDVYTRRFGSGGVSHLDVLEYPAGTGVGATIVADLASADHLPEAAFDCIIITQTLQFIYDLDAAVSTLYRILKPGGVALVTVPGISQVNRCDRWADRWCWHFTTNSMARLFGARFPPDGVCVAAHGNVLTAAAFLYGVGRPELTAAALDHHDRDYEMVITVRAEKGMDP